MSVFLSIFVASLEDLFVDVQFNMILSELIFRMFFGLVSLLFNMVVVSLKKKNCVAHIYIFTSAQIPDIIPSHQVYAAGVKVTQYI